MRRPLVAGAREHLRDEHAQHDLPRRLGVRTARGSSPDGDQEQRAKILRHGAEGFHAGPTRQGGRSRRSRN
jgi:hypothetical protein